MQGVVRSLGELPEADVHAIATYIHAAMGSPTPERTAQAKASAQRAALGPLALATTRQAAPSPQDEPALRLGAAVYAGACAGCHELGRELSSGSGLQLPLAVAVHEPTPASLIRIVLQGIAPADGEPGRWMPGFAGALTRRADDGARAVPAPAPPPMRRRWPDVAGEVRKAERTDDHLERQRRRSPGRRRCRHAAALRAARPSAAERRQVRLRPRPVRRLHGDGRRRGGVLVHHADLARCPAAASRRSKASARSTSRARCSAPSSRSRRRSAATASPA